MNLIIEEIQSKRVFSWVLSKAASWIYQNHYRIFCNVKSWTESSCHNATIMIRNMQNALSLKSQKMESSFYSGIIGHYPSINSVVSHGSLLPSSYLLLPWLTLFLSGPWNFLWNCALRHEQYQVNPTKLSVVSESPHRRWVHKELYWQNHGHHMEVNWRHLPLPS